MNRAYLLLLLPLLGGCMPGEVLAGAGAERHSEWFETGPVRKPKDELLRLVRDLMLRQGYQVPYPEPNGNTLESGWDTHLSPRYREGYRSKIEAEIVPVEGSGGGLNVRVRSTLEINDNTAYPGIAEQAQWVAAGISDKHRPRIPEPAMKLHQVLKLKLFGFNPQ